MGASHEKVVNFLFGYGNVLLAHSTVITYFLVLHLNLAQVTDIDSFAI
jgi:hypothetical protein